MNDPNNISKNIKMKEGKDRYSMNDADEGYKSGIRKRKQSEGKDSPEIMRVRLSNSRRRRMGTDSKDERKRRDQIITE